jgi:peptide/nickel transport system permease protein
VQTPPEVPTVTSTAATLGPVRLSHARRRTRFHPGTGALLTGCALLLFLASASLLAPVFTPYDPLATDASITELPPGSPGHPLGTDTLGRDLLTRVLYGGRVSLSVGVLAAGLSLLIGTAVGAVAGMSNPVLDALLMRTVDALLALPLLVVAIAVQAVTDPSLTNVVLVIGITGWMPVARVVRVQFLALRQRDFVRAAVALGTPGRRIAWRHILPNALPPILAVTAFQVSHAIMTESTLSFLGLGVPPHHPTWGNMLTAAQQHLLTGQWWTLLWPGGAIVLTLLAVNLIAEGLRQRGNPYAIRGER